MLPAFTIGKCNLGIRSMKPHPCDPTPLFLLYAANHVFLFRVAGVGEADLL